MCSLTITRGIHPELSPWLAALYVVPVYRKQGIGGMLEKKICAVTAKMGYKSIYCFSSDPEIISWYEAHNWKVREANWLHDHEVTVMEKSLIRSPL